MVTAGGRVHNPSRTCYSSCLRVVLACAFLLGMHECQSDQRYLMSLPLCSQDLLFQANASDYKNEADEAALLQAATFPSVKILRNSHNYRVTYLTNAMNFYNLKKFRESFEMLVSQKLTAYTLWARGHFMNPVLEKLIWKLSANLFPSMPASKKPAVQPGATSAGLQVAAGSPIQSILHIASEVYAVGGHSRVIDNFIQFDTHHTHHLLLTQHTKSNTVKFPDFLKHHLPITQLCPKSKYECVKHIRSASASVDLVILHIHMHDLLPVFAFAAGYQGPPVAYFDHADFTPWVGSSILDVRLVFRDSAFRMFEQRRIEKHRNIWMPLPTQNVGNVTRHTARTHFGFRSDQIVLLSMAKQKKFGTEATLLKLILPILKEHSNVVYVVVGGPVAQWGALCRASLGHSSAEQCRFLMHEAAASSAMWHMVGNVLSCPVMSCPIMSCPVTPLRDLEV